MSKGLVTGRRRRDPEKRFGFESRSDVSDTGRVLLLSSGKRVERRVGKRAIKGLRILSPRDSHQGLVVAVDVDLYTIFTFKNPGWGLDGSVCGFPTPGRQRRHCFGGPQRLCVLRVKCPLVLGNHVSIPSKEYLSPTVSTRDSTDLGLGATRPSEDFLCLVKRMVVL